MDYFSHGFFTGTADAAALGRLCLSKKLFKFRGLHQVSMDDLGALIQLGPSNDELVAFIEGYRHGFEGTPVSDITDTVAENVPTARMPKPSF